MSEHNELNALVPPAITEQPVSQTVTEGQSAIFKVSAAGTPPLKYQWFANEAAVGVDSNTYEFLDAKAQFNTQIYVKVSNSAGGVTSETVVLNVRPLHVDPFDPMNLGISTDYAAAISAQASAKPFELRKPNDQEFFRTSPRSEHHLPVASITDKQDMGHVYIITPDLLATIKLKFPKAIRAVELVLTQSLTGAAFVWPIPLAEDRGGKWNSSQRGAGAQSKTKWTNLAAGRGEYDVTTVDNPTTVEWDSFPAFRDILRQAASERLIDKVDHPLLRKLAGEKE